MMNLCSGALAVVVLRNDGEGIGGSNEQKQRIAANQRHQRHQHHRRDCKDDDLRPDAPKMKVKDGDDGGNSRVP